MLVLLCDVCLLANLPRLPSKSFFLVGYKVYHELKNHPFSAGMNLKSNAKRLFPS